MFQLLHISQDEKIEMDSENIYGDDSIQIIKEKIVEMHNKGRSEKKSSDEIYLYGTLTTRLEQRKLFEKSINISSRSSILKEKDVILMNNNNNLSIPVKNYTFEDFEKLKIKSNLNQLVSLSQSLLMGQKKYLYSIDPHNEVFDKIINNDDDTQVISLDNYLLLKFGNVKKIMYCFPYDVIKSDMSEIKQEFMFKLYFPKLFKQNIKSLQEYKNNKLSLQKPTLDDNTELLMKYLHEEKLTNVNKGISKLYFIIHPEISMRLPMELIFKLVNSVKSIPLIKYDPGNKLENRYRLYTGDKLSKNGKKIPHIVSSNGYKSGKLNLVRRRLVNENRVGFFIEDDGMEIYCQFIEDGNIEIKLNVEKSKKMDDIIGCLERNLNDKILYSLNSYLKKSGYTFPLFVDLNSEYIEIVRLDYEYELESEDYDFDLKEYENCLTHIFNLKNKTRYEKGSDVIELKYKKVSSYNKMTAINEFISIKLQYNSSNETIITELQSNFKLNRKEAVDYFTKFKQEAEIQLDTFANKSLQFIESNGFDIKIEMKQNEKMEQKLFINVYNINNEQYINYIDKYISFLRQIIEDDVDEHYKKLCKKIEIKKDDKKEASISAKVIIDTNKEKIQQLNELEKLRGSDNEEESDDDDDEIDAFARKKKDDSSSSDDDDDSSSSDGDDDWGFGGGSKEFTEVDTLALDENAEVQSMMNKVDIKRNQFGGKIPIKQLGNLLEGEKEDPATIHIDDIPEPELESESDDELNMAMMNEYEVGEDVLLEEGHEMTQAERDFSSQLEFINEIDRNSVWVGAHIWPSMARGFVYSLNSHDNPDIEIYRPEEEIREIPEGHPAFQGDDDEFFGGAKKDLTYTLEGRQNYFVNRLRNRYEDIAVKENKRGFQSYVRSCPSNMKRIPVILNKTEYDGMKDEIKDEKAIAYKDDKGEDHWFVCPRFWCFKDPNKKFTGKPLTLKQIEEGACGGLDALIPLNSKTIPDGKSIYEFTDEKYHNGKPRGSDEWKESYKKLYPGFMNKKNSKGLCMPCCFNMTDKKGNYKLSASRKRMEDECCEEEGKCAHYKYGSKKKGKSRIFIAPIKGKQLLREGQLGYLPESLENFFQFNSEKICQISKRDTKLKPNVYCMLRVGVKTKQNINNTFLASVALAIKEEERKANLNKLNIDELVKEMKSKIKRNTNLLVKFLIANKGNLFKIFFDEKTFDFKEIDIKSKDRDIFNQMKKSYGERKAKKEYSKINHAINNFLDYIEHGENVSYEYLWDLITMPIKEGGLFFKNGLNLLIFNNPRDDPIDKIELICPKGSQYNNYNYSKNRPLLMLYKVNNMYEPIVFYSRGKKEDLKIKTTIKNFTKPENILKKEGKKIWNIINYISQDIEEKCQKYPNNDLYFSKYTTNIPLKKLMKQLGKQRIKHQIINEFYETIGILTNKDIFVPCDPSPITSLLEKRFIDKDLSNIIQNIDYPEELKKLNIKLENGEKLHIPENGIIEKDGVIVGYRTNTNQLVLINPEIDLSINDYKVDKVIKTDEKNMDKQRIESIKKIKMAKNYYIFFRNLFKMKINELDNMKTKDDILKIIENQGINATYVNKMDKIIVKLKELMNENILSFDLSEKDALSLCEYLKMSQEIEEDMDCIGVTGSDNIHHFPKYNLINEQENEDLYFEKLSDELIRYEKIRKYIFLKNKYMNFDIVNYKISNSEILIMESTLLNILDKWRNDELMTTINYIKYKNIFDNVSKDDKSNYTNQYALDIKDIPSFEEKLTTETESDTNIDIAKDNIPGETVTETNEKGEMKKVYKFNDGFGNDIIYEFTKSSSKSKAFAINWFLKYILISPPDEIQKYILELQEAQKQPNRLIKTKEIIEGEMKEVLLKIFKENWESIKWDKEVTGRSMFQGFGDSFMKLWNLQLSKNTQSKPSNNNKAPDLHLSVYRNHIGKGQYDKSIISKKLKELNTLSKKENPIY